MILSKKKPDLVIGDELTTDEDRQKVEAAGIAVILENTVRPRRWTAIENLGKIFGAEDKANEIINYEAYYEDLVKSRVENLIEGDKPLVYFEWYMPWFSAGPGNSFNDLLVDEGARNIATLEYSDVNPLLNADYVKEKNPSVIVRMLTYYDGTNYTAYQNLHSNMTSRSGMSEVDAVINGQVHIIKNTLVVNREALGLLYCAKWFHPELFTDLNPEAVHADYIQRFFGKPLEGTFVFP